MQRHFPARVAMLATLATALPHWAQAQGGHWGEGYFPNLPVVTQDGKTARFYDDLLKGKLVVINFIYTSCQDICPVATARLAQVEDKLGDRMGRDFFFISMTVDPERDTPERLKEYAQAFGAGPGWSFVTGKSADIRAINYKLGERSTNLSEHRNEIVLGNESQASGNATTSSATSTAASSQSRAWIRNGTIRSARCPTARSVMAACR
jgi:protein SCO1